MLGRATKFPTTAGAPIVHYSRIVLHWAASVSASGLNDSDDDKKFK
jgi:hypothetical protein